MLSSASSPRHLVSRLVRLRGGVFVHEIADVEKGGLFEADIDEGGLHAREDAGDAPQGDRPGDAPVAVALDIELGELALLEDRHPDFPGTSTDQ